MKVLPNNDQLYIDDTLSGDQQAFAVLIERYKDMVFTLALRMVGNREEAEEIAQDAFLKVYKSLVKFKGDSKFSTWVYRITYNTCLDHIKKHRKQVRPIAIEELTDFNVKELMAMESALDRMEQEERREAMQSCLQLLDSDDSFILTLCYFEDLSLTEAAAILGITKNYAKVRLFRSRKKLAAILRTKLSTQELKYYEG